MSDQTFPEMVDALGEKPNGERTLIGQLPIPEIMKVKDIIRNYIGGNFDDDDSQESYCLYAFQDFLAWQKKQNAALAASQAPTDDQIFKALQDSGVQMQMVGPTLKKMKATTAGSIDAAILIKAVRDILATHSGNPTQTKGASNGNN